MKTKIVQQKWGRDVAKLSFKYGAMNSGKSDTLIKVAFNYEECGLKVAIIKPSVDTRGASFVYSRTGYKRPANVFALPDTNLKEAVKLFINDNGINKLNCVLVDEAQLLSRDQVDQLYDIAKNDDISVIAYGIRTDFRTELFPGSERLFALADNIEKLPTMCKCGSQAEFNCRKNNDEYVFEGEQVAIDGAGATTYEPLCGKCYFDIRNKKMPKSQQSNMTEKRILKNGSRGVK